MTAGRVTDEHTKAVVYYALVLACTNCTTCNCSEEARSTLLNELMRSSIQSDKMKLNLWDRGNTL